MVSMYIEAVPNRKSRPTILLRKSWREGKKTKKKTIANLTHLPSEAIEILRRFLNGQKFVPIEETIGNIVESKQHGHVFAVLSAIKKLGVPNLIAYKSSTKRSLILAIIIARILNPSSKLATTRLWLDTTLSRELQEIEGANEDDLYQAMDWLIQRKSRIEKKIAQRHLKAGSLVLYDLSSSYFEGENCLLAKFGYNRDLKKGKKQVNYGLLTDEQGRPIAIDIYEGNIKDSETLLDQINKLRTTFKIAQIVIVGDRGMITKGHIEQFNLMRGINWVTALKSKQIRVIFEQTETDPEKTLFEITHSDYPNERLVVCRNPQLAKKRAHDRQALIFKTEEKLKKIQRMVQNRKLFEKDKIGVRVGKEINKFKVAKLFDLKIEDNYFTYEINQKKVEQERTLDGIYVIRTNLEKGRMDAPDVVRSYKQLCNVEKAFHTIKTMDLKIRPIYHYSTLRVKAHIFICMLAYYVEWHIKEAWRSLLFSDEEVDLKKIRDPVLPTVPSENAREKARTKRTSEGFQAHSFRSLLTHLSTITRNTCSCSREKELGSFVVDTKPDEIQKRALDLIAQM
jgi:transposase